MLKYLIVFMGSGIGGGLRYWLSSFINKIFPSLFPFGTLGVNIIGSFILGYLIFGLDEKGLISPSVQLLIGIGFCGGFTTFSAFSLETFNLFRNAEFLIATINIILSFSSTILGILLAYLITR